LVTKSASWVGSVVADQFRGGQAVIRFNNSHWSL